MRHGGVPHFGRDKHKDRRAFVVIAPGVRALMSLASRRARSAVARPYMLFRSKPPFSANNREDNMLVQRRNERSCL